MWKHIIVQSIYQLFWLFFFMYGLPRLMPAYHITDECTFFELGPLENDSGYCAATLVADGATPADAERSCAIMNNCGFPCHSDRHNSDMCPLHLEGLVVVPESLVETFCGANSTGCAAAEVFSAQMAVMQVAAEADAESDWRHLDALLFNAFIMCQVRVVGLQHVCGGRRWA